MASRPTVKTLVNNTTDILNAIRNSASVNYQNYVPAAEANSDSVRSIGSVIMAYPQLQNEFLTNLVNRIGRVIVTSKMYSNPIAMFKKGILEYGETIEDIFVEIAKPFDFDPDTAEKEVFKREIPDVRTAFYNMNFQKFYKATVTTNQLKQAFLSMDGVTDLIARIVDSLYTGAAYDEFQTMKYMLARRMLQGLMYPVTVPTTSTAAMPEIVATIKGVSNDMEFMKTQYNLAGVHNHTLKPNQYILIDSRFEAKMDVDVLAAAFNMDKAEFMGHRVLIDSFGSLDIERLGQLFANDPNYIEPSEADLQALNAIPACIVDDNFFMVIDNMNEFTEIYNSQGLYWNYFYHCWKTFAVSPFANNALFVAGTPAVTAVTVTPSAANVSVGQTLQLTANVTTEYFAPQAVNWSSDNENVEVSATGMVTVKQGATGTAKITATSVFDGTKSAKCELTIA